MSYHLIQFICFCYTGIYYFWFPLSIPLVSMRDLFQKQCVDVHVCVYTL